MDIKLIKRDEFIKLMDSNERFTLVDVLSKESYEKEHIRGAISLPLDEIEKRANDVLSDKKEKIVVYCASFDCPASTKAAEMLQKMGYTNVVDYKGGLKDYKESGRPLGGSLHFKESECIGCGR